MKCCAILINYHGAADTIAAACSVLADDPTLEVIVIDNSVDAHEFNSLKQQLPAGVQLHAAPENLGFGRACNVAANSSQAEMLFLVNPDVRISPGCVSELRGWLEENPHCGAVAPRQFIDDAGLWQLPPSWLPTPLRAWSVDVALRDKKWAKRLSQALRAEALRYWKAQKPILQRALSGGVVMVRRSALGSERLMFDPRFFMYFEDSDLCQRIRRAGHGLAMVPAAKAVHHWRNQPHKNAMMAESAILYFDKYAGSANVWREKSSQLSQHAFISPLLGIPRAFPRKGLMMPLAWQACWLLELSLSPLMSPAVGALGSGAQVAFPSDVLQNFEGATVFGRLGPAIHGLNSDDFWYFEFQ